jgi:SM-20-related protein
MTAHFKPPVPLAIDTGRDAADLAAQFARDGHVRIGGILASGAPELYHYLEASRDWVQLANRPEGGAHEVAWTDWIDPASPLRERLTPGIIANARDNFQYSYAALRVPQPGEAADDPVLGTIAALLGDADVMALLARITGIARPRFVDGQATAYGPGDFLTGHDDNLAGSGRRAAFVLGMTPQWRMEWGGLLMFHDLGRIEFSGLCPQFNTLDLFTVPRYHSVSLVSPAAPRRRFAITGWLAEP